ncbi:hypothetical protein GGR57DRAFT_309099 [Xylariaceae sp. FL1272]|nr:hypothetical protein GGR57DRAFT_309099 [Xylariaceae sp. FL1272]
MGCRSSNKGALFNCFCKGTIDLYHMVLTRHMATRPKTLTQRCGTARLTSKADHHIVLGFLSMPNLASRVADRVVMLPLMGMWVMLLRLPNRYLNLFIGCFLIAFAFSKVAAAKKLLRYVFLRSLGRLLNLAASDIASLLSLSGITIGLMS